MSEDTTTAAPGTTPAEAAGTAPTATATATTATAPADGRADVAEVEERLREVNDPEIGINIVDLGLVYGLEVDDANEAIITMTLTSAACPLDEIIKQEVEEKLADLVSAVRLNWVWMPPWGPDKIRDEGREQLRAMGFNV